MEYLRLGDILVKDGAITPEQLAGALEIQKTSKRRLGTILIEEGIIDEQRLIKALEIQLGIDFIDLTAVKIPVELAAVVPQSIAKRHSVVPVKVTGEELTVAMADPLNFVALEEVRTATRRHVIPKIAATSAVEDAITALYGNEGDRGDEARRRGHGPR